MHPRDLTPLPVGSTYATITVYRDAKRVFISAYDAKTSFLRFVAIANDSTALNELVGSRKRTGIVTSECPL